MEGCKTGGGGRVALMLDIRLIRENADEISERIASRGSNDATLITRVLEIDEERRRGETERQQLQNERKSRSKEIGALRKQGSDSTAMEAEVKTIGEKITALGESVNELDKQQRDILMRIPNMPHENCPMGTGENDNPVVREWGEKPSFSFDAKNHMEIGADLGLLDFEEGANLSGSGFVVFRGAGARLERALISFLLDLQCGEHGYTEVSPPFLIRRACMEGTGQLPKFEDDMYGLENNTMFLAPTAEVPVTNLERDRILAYDALPIRYAAYTPCFRREAGSAGRESKGLIRMHQFDKVELVQVVHPDKSFEALEQLTLHAETALQRLGLAYRVIELCTGDLGANACKTYDIEVWAPAHGAYLEVSSCSNFVDYQSRRMGLRFKDSDGKNKVCHTLNGSGTALPRLYVALLETYQQEDGSVRIPEALQPFFGSDRIPTAED